MSIFAIVVRLWRWLSEPPLHAQVRIIRDVEIYDLGIIPAGTTGFVTWRSSSVARGQPVGAVMLQERIAFLEPWRNELQVWRPEDGDPTWGCFERIRT